MTAPDEREEDRSYLKRKWLAELEADKPIWDDLIGKADSHLPVEFRGCGRKCVEDALGLWLKQEKKNLSRVEEMPIKHVAAHVSGFIPQAAKEFQIEEILIEDPDSALENIRAIEDQAGKSGRIKPSDN